MRSPNVGALKVVRSVIASYFKSGAQIETIDGVAIRLGGQKGLGDAVLRETYWK
jgi:hypothetical protein